MVNKYQKKIESFFSFMEAMFFILVALSMLNLFFQLIIR